MPTGFVDPTLTVPPTATEATWGTWHATGNSTAARIECVAPVTGKQIRIMAVSVSAEGEQGVTLEVNTGEDLLGPFYLAADTQYELPISTYPWRTTRAGKGVSMLLDEAVDTDCHGIYCYV